MKEIDKFKADFMKEICRKVINEKWSGYEHLSRKFDYLCTNWHSFKKDSMLSKEESKMYFKHLFNIYSELEDYIACAPIQKGVVVESLWKSSPDYYICCGCIQLIDYNLDNDDFHKFKKKCMVLKTKK